MESQYCRSASSQSRNAKASSVACFAWSWQRRIRLGRRRPYRPQKQRLFWLITRRDFSHTLNKGTVPEITSKIGRSLDFPGKSLASDVVCFRVLLSIHRLGVNAACRGAFSRPPAESEDQALLSAERMLHRYPRNLGRPVQSGRALCSTAAVYFLAGVGLHLTLICANDGGGTRIGFRASLLRRCVPIICQGFGSFVVVQV